MKFGALQLDIVSGGRYRLDGGTMFGVVPKALWERKFPPDAQNRVGLAANCLLVRGSGFTALVASGIGDKWDGQSREQYGIEEGPSLPDALAPLGVSVQDVDALILPQLPFDQAGGSTRRVGHAYEPVFPRATLYVQEAELVRARRQSDRDRTAYLPENWLPYATAGRLETVVGEKEIRPGLRVMPLPGHSAGMQAIRVDSEGKTAFYFADALPTSAHIPIAWTMADDAYPVERVENKKRLLDRAVAERWLCVFARDPDVPWGTLVDEINGKRRVHVVPAAAPEY